LLYTVLSMVQKVEESCNFVWRVDQPRSLGRRFSEYLSVMIVGPTVIVAAIGLMATLRESSIVRAATQYEPFGTILLMTGRLAPYLMIIGVFTFLYAFIPNTRVRFRAALAGGVTAGVAWATAGALFASFVSGSSGTMVIYAGFAIVIVALIWLHMSWLILLLGVQLAFYVQNPQYLRPGRGDVQLNASLRERVALSLMYLIVNDYQGSQQRWTINRLAEHLDVPGAAIGPIVTALEKKGLLIIADDDTWLPARDPAVIQLAEVIDAVRKDEAGPRLSRIRDIAPAVNAAKRAENALKESLEQRTLKDLVNER
jgi:membrane protein